MTHRNYYRNTALFTGAVLVCCSLAGNGRSTTLDEGKREDSELVVSCGNVYEHVETLTGHPDLILKRGNTLYVLRSGSNDPVELATLPWRHEQIVSNLHFANGTIYVPHGGILYALNKSDGSYVPVYDACRVTGVYGVTHAGELLLRCTWCDANGSGGEIRGVNENDERIIADASAFRQIGYDRDLNVLLVPYRDRVEEVSLSDGSVLSQVQGNFAVVQSVNLLAERDWVFIHGMLWDLRISRIRKGELQSIEGESIGAIAAANGRMVGLIQDKAVVTKLDEANGWTRVLEVIPEGREKSLSGGDNVRPEMTTDGRFACVHMVAWFRREEPTVTRLGSSPAMRRHSEKRAQYDRQIVTVVIDFERREYMVLENAFHSFCWTAKDENQGESGSDLRANPRANPGQT